MGPKGRRCSIYLREIDGESATSYLRQWYGQLTGLNGQYAKQEPVEEMGDKLQRFGKHALQDSLKRLLAVGPVLNKSERGELKTCAPERIGHTHSSSISRDVIEMPF